MDRERIPDSEHIMCVGNDEVKQTPEETPDCKDEKPLFEATCVLNETMYRKYLRAGTEHKKLIYLWGMALFMLIMLVTRGHSFDEYLVFTSLIIVIFIPLFEFLLNHISIVNFRKDKSLFNLEQHLKFYKDRLTAESVKGSGIYPYNELYKVKETNEFFLLYSSKNRYVGIPKVICSRELIEFLRRIRR